MRMINLSNDQTTNTFDAKIGAANNRFNILTRSKLQYNHLLPQQLSLEIVRVRVSVFGTVPNSGASIGICG